MSIDATRWAWAQKIPAGPKLALLSLADRADAAGRAWPSMARLATDTALGQRTLYRHIAALAALGLVSVESTPGRGRVYRLHMTRDERANLPRRGGASPLSRRQDPPAVEANVSEYGTVIEPSKNPPSRADARGETPPSFAAFWAAYPRKTGKKAALKAWKAAGDKPGLPRMLSVLERQKQSAQWRRDGGRYVPNPATWLNQGRWDDETEETALRERTLDEYLDGMETAP